VGLAQDPQVRAHLHSLAAASLVTTGDQRGLDHLREALAVLDPKINPLGTANAISIEGRFHHLAGRHKKAIDLLERAAGLVDPIAEQDSVTQFAASIIPRIYGYLAGAYQHYGRLLGHEYDALSPTGSGIDRVDPQQLLDEALQTALDNFQTGETSDLVYLRFEGRRCLAAVRFHRGEFDEAERLCAAASELVSGTESRLSRLWLGPLFIEALLAAGLRAEAEGAPDEAAAKRGLAAEHLATYQELVAECQSPRFTREATRLADLIALSFKAF
jgi:tetratricopeptide (TPR) repeat protein